MHIVLSVEQGKVWACLTESQTEPRERLHSGEPQCFVQSTSQTRKVMPGVSQKKKKKKKRVSGGAVQVFSFKVSLGNFILFFFFSSEVTKLKRWDLCLRTDPCPISTPCLPDGSENGSCAPYVEVTKYLLSCLLERKKRKLCFCHWFSHMKLISSPFSGSEAAVS